MAASAPKLPTWYRVLAVIVGVFSIAVALIVLIEPLLALWILIFLLALGLLVMGMDRLVAGISGHPFSPFARMMAMSEGPEPGAPTGAGPGAPPPPSKP